MWLIRDGSIESGSAGGVKLKRHKSRTDTLSASPETQPATPCE